MKFLVKKRILPRWLTCWPLGAALAVATALPVGVAAQGSQAPAGQPAESVPQQTGKPLALKPDLPGMHHNHRLILKDGSYQLVREYKVEGDRVKYLSVERADWEELPADMVDWDATRKWEQVHAEDQTPSPAMQEAEEVDKEENQARDELKARTPTVAPGLDLPDENGVFVLDTFHGTPELVQLPATDMSLNRREKHGLGVLNPMAGVTADMELEGRHSRIHLHVNDPTIYLSLDTASDSQPITSRAMVVNTTGAKAVNGPQGAHSTRSGFAIVKVDERNAVRIVGAVHMNRDGSIAQNENVIAAKGQVMAGNHWMLIKPDQSLKIGEYALVEMLSPTEISPTVWDFRVDPTKGDNPGSIAPILKPVDAR